MLPKKNRLPGFLIPKTLKHGQHRYFPLFNLIILPPTHSQFSKPPSPSLVAFLAPQKLSKKVVFRNRTRRLLAQSVRQLYPQIKPGYHLIFIAKKTLDQEKLDYIKPQVKKALNDARLLKD